MKIGKVMDDGTIAVRAAALSTPKIRMSILCAAMMAAFVSCIDIYDYYHVHPTADRRTVGAFSGVALDGVGMMYINPFVSGSADFGVMIAADADIVGSVSASVDTDDVLRIGMVDKNVKYEDGEVRVDCKLWGIGMDTDDGNGCKRGALDISVRMPSEMRSVTLNGKGNIKIQRGSANDFVIYHDGDGDIDARDFDADTITVVHTGRGQIIVSAGRVLNVYIDSDEGVIRSVRNPMIRIPAMVVERKPGNTNPVDPDPDPGIVNSERPADLPDNVVTIPVPPVIDGGVNSPTASQVGPEVRLPASSARPGDNINWEVGDGFWWIEMDDDYSERSKILGL